MEAPENPNPKDNSTADGLIKEFFRGIRSLGWIGAIVTVVSSGAMFVFWEVFNPPKGGIGFGHVASLILVSFAALLGILAGLSALAEKLHIQDAKQPFGLPEGSVRAILTIAFIVLVGVLSSYLITSMDGRSAFTEKPVAIAFGLEISKAEDLRRSYGADGLLSISPTPGASDKYDVSIWPRVDHRLADDISKQILTMLSTILASMIGFYFGSTSSGTSDPSAAKRAFALAAIGRLLASAPKPEELRAICDDILTNGQIVDPDKKTVQDYKENLPKLKEALQAAERAGNSSATTADQMQKFADDVDGAVTGLQEIKSGLREIAKKLNIQIKN
jgi:hypothetical protein